MKKIVIFLFLLVVFLQAKSQSVTDDWAKAYDSYGTVWQQPVIYLVCNQDKISGGDTLFFKAYFLTPQLSQIEGVQLITVALTDSKADTKVSLLLKMNDGIASNQIVIPKDFDEGIYSLIAYSSRSRNFTASQMFKKNITVVKTNSIVAKEAIELIARPEGGHLVAGISNKVSIYTSRPNVPVKLTNGSTEIASGSTDGNGLTTIVFTPISTESYFVNTADGVLTIQLPAIKSDGVTMMAETVARNQLSLKVEVACPLNSSWKNERLFFVVTGSDKVYETGEISFAASNRSSFGIDLSKAGRGINTVSILDKSANLLASRDFYNLNGSQPSVKVSVSPKNYGNRDKVRVEVQILDNNGKPIEGEFSASVSNNAFFAGPDNFQAVNSTALIGLERNFVPGKSGNAWQGSLDNLMILQSKDIAWKEILSKKYPAPKYSYSSVILKRGTAFDNATNKPLPDESKIMFYLQKDMLHYETFTLNNGRVQITLPDIYGSDEFFYVAQEKYGKEIRDIRIEWDTEDVVLPASPLSVKTNQVDDYAAFSEKTQIIDKSYRFYEASKRPTLKPVNKKLTPFEEEIVEADIVVDPSDFTPFTSMAEFVKEAVPALRRRTRDKKDIVLVSLSEPLPMPTTDPIFIIDGIATRSSAFFLSLKPEDVLRVKIINASKKLVPLQMLGKTGIVIVETKFGNMREPLNDTSRIVQGLSIPAPFHQVTHQQGLNRNPDFRSVLFWNSSIKTDSNGKAAFEFCSSDDVGRFTIKIDGLAGRYLFTASEQIEISVKP